MGNKKSKEFQQEVKEEDVEIFNKEHMTNEDYEFFSSLTNFSKEQIKSMFEIFMENNPTGELNKRDFMRLYCSLRPEPNEIIYKISAHVFGAFDIDKNGKIDFKEFLISYALTSRGDLKSKLEFAFRMYDKDSNLKLDVYELEEVLNGMLQLLNSTETDSKSLAKQIIKELGLSKDGTISKDDFINGLLRNYSLRTIMNPF